MPADGTRASMIKLPVYRRRMAIIWSFPEFSLFQFQLCFDPPTQPLAESYWKREGPLIANQHQQVMSAVYQGGAMAALSKVLFHIRPDLRG
jgi:hypothetical protein